jgi:calcineurin-like phosphoesterase family protein/2'-5' RNA ligase
VSTSFFIEFRAQGFAKQYAKWVNACIHREARRLRIRKLKERRFVSHITLFGPARTNNFRRVIAEVERTCRKYTLVPFKLGGFDNFQNPDANWLYLGVQPSPDLEQLRYELAKNLFRSERMISNTCQPYDHKSKCKFHAAIGKYAPRDRDKFEKLLDYAETKCSLETFKQHNASVFSRLFNVIKRYIFRVEEDSNPNISLCLLRVTVLGRGSRIQCEYDLVLKKLLSRREALSRYWYNKSIERLKELLNPPKEQKSPISNGSIYFIGDTHFDHRNIIKYTHRPFSNVTEMNKTIKNNWNATVSDNDIVYFLGDWTFGWGHKPAEYWKRQLKGVIVSIRGSHDQQARGIKFENTKVLHVNEHSFLLIHNPEDRKTKWQGWIIHGHVHNKKPFIDGEKKTINVSAEVINYRPVSLSYLLSLNLDSIKRMRTIDSKPERW